jgi:hypothetical protein
MLQEIYMQKVVIALQRAQASTILRWVVVVGKALLGLAFF